jgi:integrase/recombinase XerD
MSSISEIQVFKNDDEFGSHKVFDPKTLSLSQIFNLYFKWHVAHASPHTIAAKTADIESFLKFYIREVGVDKYHLWTPSVSRHYQNYLGDTLGLKATTVNRKIATIRHAATWMNTTEPFIAGHPFQGVSDIHIGVITWKGLSNTQIMRLKAACDIRVSICTRNNQDPILERAVFYSLLYTGLRESELIKLNMNQYNGKAFINIKRKGKKISARIPVSGDAKQHLDIYLKKRPFLQEPGDPLFISTKNKRLSTKDIQNICTRIKNQANAQLPEEEKFHFSPHSLRHAFLKRIADKEGIHAAQEISGNVSMKEIFRYTRPSDEDMEEMVKGIFD